MNKKQIEKVLADAPDAATHTSPRAKGIRIENGNFYAYYGEKNHYAVNRAVACDMNDVSNLSDLRAQLELINEVEAKDKRIAELEQECELSAHELADNHRRIAELKKQLEPDLFWDVDDGESSFCSARDAVENYLHDESKVGDTFEFQAAAILPNVEYKLVSFDNELGAFEIEQVKGGDV